MPHCTKCGADFQPVRSSVQRAASRSRQSCPAAIVATASGHSGLRHVREHRCMLELRLGLAHRHHLLLIDKRPYVRFHAAQSIVTFGGLHVIRIVLSLVFGFGWFFGSYSHYGYAGWGSLASASRCSVR